MRKNTRAALAAAPLSLALLLAACGSDDDSADTTTTITSTTEATSPSSESETTAPPASSETTAPPPDGGDELPGDLESWASELVRAWGAGDRDRAGQLAAPEVVEQLFAHADPGGDDWEPAGCEGAAGTTYCTFTSASRDERLTTGQATMPDDATGAVRPITRVMFEPGAE